jgi:endonuclease/exonuclease/phosphatase family metal-dependent hydrolase
MNWRLPWMTVVALACAYSAWGETPLTVMTFNLRYGLAMDGDNAWPHRRDILVDTIRKCDPDILGTQECLDFQAEYIAEKLPEYRWIGVGRDADGRGEMTAVFYRKKSLMPVESGFLWLSETPEVPGSVSWDTSLTRMATWVRFRQLEKGVVFQYFNTHFDHKGEEARQQSALLLSARIGQLPPEFPAILTGDFNAAAETSAPYKVFMDKGFKDAWTATANRQGPDTTWCGFSAPDPKAHSRIDWILYRGAVEAISCETVVYTENGHYPSDHFPVVAHLQLKD